MNTNSVLSRLAAVPYGCCEGTGVGRGGGCGWKERKVKCIVEQPLYRRLGLRVLSAGMRSPIYLQKGVVLMKKALQAMCEQNGMEIYYSSTETRRPPGPWGRSVPFPLLGRTDS